MKNMNDEAETKNNIVILNSMEELSQFLKDNSGKIVNVTVETVKEKSVDAERTV